MIITGTKRLLAYNENSMDITSFSIRVPGISPPDVDILLPVGVSVSKIIRGKHTVELA